MPDKWRQLLAFVFGMDYNRKAPTKEMMQIEEEKKSHEEEKKGDQEMEPAPRLADELKKKKFENLGVWVESNIYFKNFKRIKL